ncbi:GH1 family beta-glucosidase [Bifidobacterium eulemuris]|uniref:Beta-glucosidase n=1 Tax=Bifidobacterium eulemuris TaxID=1765219 RepID=A0A261GBG2_9BIFI|nr:GH1 family beta-glucosidase [Bifidobacterium eulemuris]OZG68583.1 beta-glucosidase [Bifidobacterium eulemuris]QOL32710.1 beta-glucosidase [Bifidobacterium eulemuris]
MTTTFPEGFLFGTSTASYQIEGAVNEGGRCPSIWDTYSHTPGKVLNSDTGDIACDSYHRWQEDIAMLADLGVDAYRFSVAMPRVMPVENGAPNAEGLDYYERFVDMLLAKGIAPIVTLYHWDLPQYLGDKNGWLNRETAYRLGEYAGIVAGRLGDRVHTYITLNEPWCSSYLSYGGTEHAPGLGLGPGAFPAVHHLNLAHGLMCQAVRAEVGEAADLSVTLNLQMNRGDADAVHRLDLIANRAFLDPMLRGYYPDELFAITHGICDWNFVQDGDLEQIHQPIDVLGINYYSTNLLAMSDRPQFPQSTEASTNPGASDVDFLPTEGPHTEMGWNIDPKGLTDLLVRVWDDYRLPLIVTENGIAVVDTLETDGNGDKAVHDVKRVDYYRRHLAAALDAIDQGVDLRGYCAWSLMDNFEWAWGYARRFGLVYTDYETLERIPKDSFLWYRDVIAKRGL